MPLIYKLLIYLKNPYVFPHDITAVLHNLRPSAFEALNPVTAYHAKPNSYRELKSFDAMLKQTVVLLFKKTICMKELLKLQTPFANSQLY